MKQPGIGTLRHKLVLQEPIQTPDGGGGIAASWTDVTELWARVRPVTGKEAFIDHRLSGRVTHEVTLRYRANLTPAMRFSLTGRVLEIQAVLNIGERNEWLRCLCQEQSI